MAVNLNKIRKRYEAHLQKGEHLLRPAQVIMGNQFLADLDSKNPDGTPVLDRYAVSMTGSGKTVWALDTAVAFNTTPSGKQEWDEPTLILVPTKEIRDQFYKEATEGVFQLPKERVGVYDPKISDKKIRRGELGKDIVIMTYAAFRRFHEKGLKFDRFKHVFVDEAHMDPRGDVTGKAIRDCFFNGEATVTGLTATHLYKNGKTVGDYLFAGRRQPFFEQTVQQAVNMKSMPEIINIIVEVNVAEGASVESEEEISERTKERLIKDEAIKQAVIKVLKSVKHPISGKPLSEMKLLIYTRSVDEAHKLSARINEENGNSVAAATSGRPEDVRNWVNLKASHDAMETPILVNNRIFEAGYNDPSLEGVIMAGDGYSPIREMQGPGRVARFHPKEKSMVKLVINIVSKDSRGLVWGDIAGGLVALDETHEYGPTSGNKRAEYERSRGLAPEEPPEIDGLRIYVTQNQLAFYRQKKDQQRWRDSLQKKPDTYYTCAEMAKELHVQEDILYKQIYEPLEAAYNVRRDQQQYIEGRRMDIPESGIIPLRGQRFNTERIGHFKTESGAKSEFCLDRQAAALCRYILFGHLTSKSSDWLNKSQTKILLDIGDAALQTLAKEIETAYTNRTPYQRVIKLAKESRDGNKIEVSIPIEDILFFLDEKKRVQIGFAPEALKPLYQLANFANPDRAEEWWNKHKIIPNLKSHHWLNKEEFAKALDLDQYNEKFAKFWGDCEKRVMGSGDPIMGDHFIFGASKKRFSEMARGMFCMHENELEWAKYKLGMEHTYDREKDAELTREIKSGLKR